MHPQERIQDFDLGGALAKVVKYNILKTQVPQWGPGAKPRWGSAGKPEACYVMRLKIHLQREKEVHHGLYGSAGTVLTAIDIWEMAKFDRSQNQNPVTG